MKVKSEDYDDVWKRILAMFSMLTARPWMLSLQRGQVVTPLATH